VLDPCSDHVGSSHPKMNKTRLLSTMIKGYKTYHNCERALHSISLHLFEGEDFYISELKHSTPYSSSSRILDGPLNLKRLDGEVTVRPHS